MTGIGGLLRRLRCAGRNARGGGPGGAKNAAVGGGVWLIVGLGNPGGKYEDTRHNVGFRAVDKIAAATGIEVRKNRFRALVGEGRYMGKKLVLLKPQTYMNASGESVSEAVRYYKPAQERLIAIYDDVDIAFGSIRVRAFGSPGTHNGMRSLADYLDNDIRFPRVRIGIGRQPAHIDLKDYVLARFSAAEREVADKAAADAAAAALCIVEKGIELAMNLHNPRRA